MKKINDLTNDLNDIIQYMFQEKIFLLHIFIAIIVITAGLLMEFSKIEMCILILTISISLRGSIKYSFNRREGETKKIIGSGAMMIFDFISASFIGYFLFCRGHSFNPQLFYQKICNSIDNTYLLCLIASPLISIIGKLLARNKHTLSGGIISGHAAFVTTVLLLSLNSSFLAFAMLFIPALIIIMPRCFTISNSIEPILKGFGGTTVIITILIAIQEKFNIGLIMAIVLILLLVIFANNKKVHKKYEIFLGILTGTISTVLILIIFQNFKIF